MSAVVAVRLDVVDSWQRCRRCHKLKVLLVGGVADRPADLHLCLGCDEWPAEVWGRQERAR